MKALHIEMSSTSPLVTFDAASATLRIKGESYPENSFDFYDPILDWTRQALGQLSELVLEIDVSYMNSSSTKCMLDLLDLLEEGHGQGRKVKAVWRYDEDNPRSLDLAEEFREDVTFEFIISPR